MKREPVGKRIPFDKNQLSIQPVLPTLRNEPVHKMLHTGEHVFPVIIVPGNCDYAKVHAYTCRMLLLQTRTSRPITWQEVMPINERNCCIFEKML